MGSAPKCTEYSALIPKVFFLSFFQADIEFGHIFRREVQADPGLSETFLQQEVL